MKNLKNSILIAIALGVVACGKVEEDQLTAKTKLLKEKEEQLSDLKSEISELKQQIAELDTTLEDNRIAVKVINIEAGLYKNPFQIQGLVESEENILITPEVPGKITAILVKEGQRVSKGDVLATMDGSVAQSQLAELYEALELSRTNYERQKKLWEQEIGAEMQYLQAKSTYERMKKSYEAAETQASKYTLRAPISGTVDQIMANVGEFVGSLTGGPIMRIVDINNVKVVANVSEKYISQMNVGQEVEIYYPSLDLKASEKIEAIGSVINPDNRTFQLIIRPNSNNIKLKPNMLSLITAYDFNQEGVISVPTRLIRVDRTGHFVYVVVSNEGRDVVERRYIELGKQFPTNTIITSGLKQGDQVVNEGANKIIAGDQVKIIEAAG